MYQIEVNPRCQKCCMPNISVQRKRADRSSLKCHEVSAISSNRMTYINRSKMKEKKKSCNAVSDLFLLFCVSSIQLITNATKTIFIALLLLEYLHYITQLDIPSKCFFFCYYHSIDMPCSFIVYWCISVVVYYRYSNELWGHL